MTGVIRDPSNLAANPQPSPVPTGPKSMTTRDWALRRQLNGPPMRSDLDQQSQQSGSVVMSEQHLRVSSTQGGTSLSLSGSSRNESLPLANMDPTIDGEVRRGATSSSSVTLRPHEVSSAPNHASTLPEVPRHRPPKPKTANLFIPKKAVVRKCPIGSHHYLTPQQGKRPLPSDAPYPDPKRKPSGTS
jgi:hypothetical protein